MAIRVAALTGAALAAAIPALAALRMTVFRAWPYLYDGALTYEQTYLAKFATARDAVIVAAFDDDRIVGAATGSPMVGHADAFAEPLRARGYDIAQIFYCGESVLLDAYRGQGIGNAFFDHREAQARRIGGVTHVTFCGVVRPADHPLKPAGYVPLDAFWRKRGYVPMPGVVGSFAWKDIDQGAETDKAMQFWIKALASGNSA